jgi:anhydro-N-acetylmuramic acid kinase
VSRGFLNVGGIANLTVIPSEGRWLDVVGFDTGPGNMIIDHVARKLCSVDCDQDGSLSSKGRPSEALLSVLLDHAYFAKVPPKSAGRELFGAPFAERFIRLARNEGLSREDALATACMLTARSVRQAYQNFAEDRTGIKELYVSGGGVKNRTLMTQLSHLFAPTPVFTTEELGVPPSAKEALLFAVLANQAIDGVPSSLPQVTGATRRVILGKIVP